MAPNASSMFPFSQTEPSTDLVSGSSWGVHGEGPQNYQDFPDNGSCHSGDAEEFLFTSGQSTPRGSRTDQPPATDAMWTAARTVSAGAPRTHVRARVNSSKSSSSLSPTSHLSPNMESTAGHASTLRNEPQPTGPMAGMDPYLLLDTDATAVPQAYWTEYSLDMNLHGESSGVFPLASAGPLHVVPAHMHLGTEPGVLDNSSPSSWECFSSSISRTSSPATIDETWLSAPLSPHSSPGMNSSERKVIIKSEDRNAQGVPQLDDPINLSQTLIPRRPGCDGESARDHPLYKNAAPQPDGFFHCPWEGHANCNHKPEKLKCNYDKFVDSHMKPYRCKAESCEGARFSSTACLLRHEREAHGLHGHGEKPFLCMYEGCERAAAGNGFPRQWNLRDHMKRVHNDHGSTAGSPPSATAGQPSKGRKRKTDVPEPQTTASRKASVKNVPAVEPVQQTSKPLLEQWLDHRRAVEDMVRGLNKPEDTRSLQQITEVQKRLAVMAKMTTELSAMPKSEMFPAQSRRSYVSG
ncbi:hypothetical protein CDD80_1772 [Ophiocordyceps camponoti-rufipedis]|uniref:C2H2-type domain-containing protein n=1 Tax=Ophiocordyceps camponoti-rufipedis TaxID=2004952 RepID=A0A2C5Z8N3_9HYPO|nr:hypothetical protein CDD80_1772 [Ophiocordyceps camponoti-rufipedis]